MAEILQIPWPTIAWWNRDRQNQDQTLELVAGCSLQRVLDYLKYNQALLHIGLTPGLISFSTLSPWK